MFLLAAHQKVKSIILPFVCFFLELLTLLLYSIYCEYEIHDEDFTPDYKTAVSL